MNGKAFLGMGESMVLPSRGTIPSYLGIMLKATIKACQCCIEMIMWDVTASSRFLREFKSTGGKLTAIQGKGFKTTNRQK